ncbi:transcriptional regulator GlxA family with amidase domain [Dyadobacter sp. BE34]|uniref:Transcriptional regulator GlxA family with amidase domain n=1 Tax=Dyadobacter fermentans TaxID=94254 RepID=A0ABU1QXC6_9BACT|nr:MULTISPECIES: helix-turn-helix domain-containing protein [Dyadobacter]MDR6804925.1 transcriptional regulator GlxA family with amidase domain [Dyadobacter fermentans]MDR7043316.1 transcriptional regulator GlxA family with amidase domain [Dyadobacter sp. BE242]MDR7197628.1 transcriptional regulator GlxA family with amidase domain [Dyadobacter sp. BE34]MDR7214939.1 transcriptional regulator GlxA family with amidase domain [Dyadobacter sp. BE31]MDR7262474.1 transcriptional regulator GlxA family
MRTRHISVIVYEDVLLTALSSTVALLAGARDAVVRSGKMAPFEIDLVSVHVHDVQLNLPVQFHCGKTLADDFETDVIVIPPMNTEGADMDQLLLKYGKLTSWLAKKYHRKAQLISLCTGAYFVAECGLLNGMPATSHWGAMDDMRKRYPLVNFRPERVVTQSEAIITGGGGFSALSAILYFIEKTCGKETAITLSKYYALDYGRTSQSIFTIFSGHRGHSDQDIHRAQTYIESEFKADISVEQIACEVNMSKRNFIRRFKSATTLNPIEYIQRIKIEAAKKSLEAGESNIAYVTYDVGYNDLKTFRTIFKRITGLTPIEYRNRYNTETLLR